MEGCGSPVHNAAFSPDGAWLATVSANGMGRLWPISDSLIQAHLESATRVCLGVDERRAYLDESDEEAQTAFESCQLALGQGR
jgi:WD40 repeat protein